MTERGWLILILALYMLLAGVYSVATPIFEASDELWHYPMVQTIAATGHLPVQDAANIGPWRQEGSQPPLYYLIAALLTGGIDTSDMPLIRRQNPHADIGVVLPDGNINMMTHRTEQETFPWRGTVLAVHVARFFSIVLGAGTVYVSYRLAAEVFPYEAVIRLGAAAFTAFLPMFLFISGSVNNDNLSNLTGNLLLLLIVRLVAVDRKPHWRDYVLVGITAGAGLLSKLNIGFLIPLVVIALLVVSYRQRSWRPLIAGGFLSGTLTILVAGWWYWRNQQLYGDPTGLNVFLEIVGRRLAPATLLQLWSERHSFTQSYWGFFGGMNVPMPQPIYQFFDLVGGTGLLGAAFFFLFRLRNQHHNFPWMSGWLPALFTIIWPVITFLSYLRWTSETPASQGRLVFGAVSAISLWMVVGLVWWLPRRLRPVIIFIVSGCFLAVAAAAPFVVIAPAYQETNPPHDVPQAVLVTFSDPYSAGRLDLLEANISPESTEVRPESYVFLDTLWRINQPLDRDWSLFVHLVTPDGVIISQRDIYPAQGLLASSDLPAGRVWHNQIAVWVPPTAYAPAILDINVGWYHLPTGERLALDNQAEFFPVGQVQVLPRESDLSVPNPMRVNFGDQIELVGYEITDLSPAVGETFDVTLYWQGLHKLEEDYKVFVQVIDPATLTKYASSDAMPAQWTAPTSGWQPGELIVDRHPLTITPDGRPGIYELQIGLYRETENGLARLRIFTPDGGQAYEVLQLSRVRITPAENGVTE